MSQQFHIEQLDGGITLLGEPMAGVSSAAFTILVPVGAATDPQGREGVSGLLSEMLNKGAGSWSSRELSQQFEDLGIHRSHTAGIEVSLFSGAMLGENLCRALELYATVLCEPRLPVEELDSVKQLALQDLQALEDDLGGKVMTELANRFYPSPFGRSQLGTVAGVEASSIETLQDYYSNSFRNGELLIAVAGKFDWPSVLKTVKKAFSAWSGTKSRLPVGEFATENSVHHIDRDTSQVQIALAYPSVSIDHPEYYAARVGVGVLSGGMSGRLFVEVREKRGLVYRVSASHSAARHRAAVFASAGTTPENSKETLSVMLEQLRGVAQNLSSEELARAKVDLKAKVIMRSESTSVRASSLVNDWWNIARLRTIEEVKQNINDVSAENVAQHIASHPVGPLTLVSLGPEALELS